MVIPFIATERPIIPSNPYSYKSDNAVFSYSDCDNATTVWGSFKWMNRPHCRPAGMELLMPGGRVRFRTSSPNLLIGVRYYRIREVGAWDKIGVILADGAVVGAFSSTSTSGREDVEVSVALGSSADRLIEIVMPYGQIVLFMGVDVDDGYDLAAAPERPASRIAIHGDSIIEGYYTTRIDKTAPFLLSASLPDYQCINMGAGGYRLSAVDGTLLANMGCDGIVSVMGANSAPLGLSCQSVWEDMVGRIRAIQPTVPIVLVTLLWKQGGLEASAETFRQGTRNAVAALSDANITLVEGPDLVAHSSDRYHDDVHLNDLGNAELAENLAPYLVTALS